MLGVDAGTLRMRRARSTIWATWHGIANRFFNLNIKTFGPNLQGKGTVAVSYINRSNYNMHQYEFDWKFFHANISNVDSIQIPV